MMLGPTFKRHFAERLLLLAERILPAERSDWASAMRADWLQASPDDAVGFAAGCLAAALRIRSELVLRTARDVLWPPTPQPSISRPSLAQCAHEPRVLGLAGAALAAAAGVLFLLDARAPWRLAALNAGAFVLGVALWSGLRGSRHPTPRGGTILLLAILLVLTAIFGSPAGGAARWASLGPFRLQVSLLTVPAMLVLYARAPDRLGSLGLMLAAVALSLQPDRGMAGALACAAGGLVLCRPALGTGIVAGAAALGFIWTLSVPDQVPGTLLTTGVLNALPTLPPFVAVALMLGAAAILAPLARLPAARSSQRAILVTFGALWGAVLLASVIGNYPTPLLGYGGTAILSYLLSASLLPSVGRQSNCSAPDQTIGSNQLTGRRDNQSEAVMAGTGPA